MESRETIINNLIKEVTQQINQKFISLDKIQDYLKNYNKFFTISEIEEYQEKISMLKYLTFTNEEIEVNIYYILEIKKYLIDLREKKGKFIRKIYNECINSVCSYQFFFDFIMKSEFYFKNNKHYFKKEEIEKYNKLWFELEIENALILSDNEELKIKQKWNKNYENILRQVEKMLLYLDSLDI